MDPLAHTLVGASLAEAGLKRLSPFATAAILIGANAPDIDAVTYLIDRDLSLGIRRGWTHGALAMAVTPLVVTAIVSAAGRWLARAPAAAPPRHGPLLLVSTIAVLSHPLLDWLNSYGIRLLMPIDARWFYGDTLFIVDPWMWLLAGIAVVLGWTTSRLTLALTAAGAATLTAILLRAPLMPPTAKWVWCGGLVLVVALRLWLGRSTDPAPRRRVEAATRVALALLAIYIVSMRVGSLVARHQVEAWLDAQGISSSSTTAMPMPATPLARDVVARGANLYYFVLVDWLRSPALRFSSPPVAINGPNPITEAALRAREVQGLKTWLRFPSYDVLRTGAGYRVRIRDVRFWRMNGDGGTGIGVAAVDLDQHLRPLPHRTDRSALSPPATVAPERGSPVEIVRREP